MKRDRILRRANREHGQSLVEFALTLPLLLMLLLGTIDLGLGFKTYIGLTNAAREGARWISINPTDRPGAEARIGQEVAHNGLSYADISTGGNQVTFSPNKSTYEAGNNVTVSILYEYKLLTGFVPGMSSVQFEASATMVVLYDD